MHFPYDIFKSTSGIHIAHPFHHFPEVFEYLQLRYPLMDGLREGAVVAILDEEVGVLFEGEVAVEAHDVLVVEGGEGAEGFDLAVGEGG